jgi:subtilase family serine protease
MKTPFRNLFALILIFSCLLSGRTLSQEVNRALKFDGINDYINVGNWWNYQEFTVQMWIKPGASQVTYANIIDNNHDSYNRWVCQQWCGGNGNIINCFTFGINTVGGAAIIQFTLSANVWQHLVLIKRSLQTEVYVNGVLIDTKPCSGTISGSGVGQDNLIIGNWNGGGRCFNGEMDDIRLWNYALPPSQVYASPFCELSGNEAGLVAYYKMNQGIAEGNNTSITTATDESGNGHHGLLVGFNLTGATSNFVSSTLTACSDPPTITCQPVGKTKCIGSPMTFTVGATGAMLTYQWRKNTVAIIGATNATYTIPVVSSSDAGAYDVVVTGNASPPAISTTAILTVENCPCITAGLVAYYPFNGNANDESGNGNDGTSNGAMLTADRYNISARAQFFNGSSYINIGDKDALNPHLHDMTVALWVKSSQRRHQRFYSKGSYGGSQSGYALMEFGSTGKVTLLFAAGGHEHAITTNDPILNDGSWHFIAGIINRDGDLELWADGVKQRGDVILGSKSIADHVNADVGAGTGNAGIGAAPVSWGFTEYSVGSIDDIHIFNREITSDEIEALFAYTGGCTAAVITSGPTSETRCAGESVTFSVTTVGTALTYQWRKNGIGITGATDSTLTLSAVSPSDVAVYDVVVSAALPPSVISQTATLTLNTAPTISVNPTSSTGCTGMPITFSVTATGTELNYQWRKNDTNIDGATNDAYTIASVTASDAGSYDVLVSGSCSPSMMSDKATLTVVQSPVLDFSGNPNFTASACSPMIAGPATRFRFEMKYSDAGGNPLQPGEPKLHLDYEGNGIFTNANDLNLTMYPLDAADNDVTDGKLYFIELPTLPLGTNYKVTYTATSVTGCSSSFGPLDGPSVITASNLAIYANDISFSNPHPDPASLITVTAVIRNLTPTPAANFYVRLANQAFPLTSYPDILVSGLAGNSTTLVSWAITTPNVASWNPIQVIIDPANIVTETNEYDNQAIRPFVNGNFAVAGNIAITAAPVPASVCPAPYTYVTVCGRAQYTNTTVQLLDPSTAGATVTIHVEETDQNFSGNTNASGNYCIQVPAPISSGLYHLLVSVTDYTIDGSTTTQFTVLPPCVVNNNVGGPDLVSSIDVSATEIFVGGSISGSVTISNVGNQAADASTASFTAPNATPSTALTLPTSALAPGNHSTSSFSPITFNTPGYFSVYAMANKDFSAYEINYNNNTSSRTIRVCPNSPDLAAGYRGALQVYQCGSLEMTIGNGTCLPVNQAFMTTLRVLQNNTVIGTYPRSVTQTVPRDGSITLSYVNIFPAGGPYQIQFTVDDGNSIAETDENNNSYTNSFTVMDCNPDLQVTVPCTPVATTDPQYPGTITINTLLTNGGNATAQAPFVVDFEVNTNHYPVTITNDLNGGNSVNVPVTIPTPPYDCPVLTAFADANNTVAESNENNNTAQMKLYWDFSPGGTCNTDFWSRIQPVGVPVPLSVGLYNAGGYRASTVRTQFEVSGPGISGWINLGMATSTNVGQTCGCPLIASLPTAFVFLQAGTYSVRMTTDAVFSYAECNENNNVLVVAVEVGQTPDYRILSQHIAPSLLNPAIGQQLSIALTYENIGSSGYDPMNLGVKVDEIALDQMRVPGLLANTSNAVQVTNQWSSIVPGIHVIRGIVDVDDEISETTKANNQATRAVVVGQTADLIFAQFEASNHSPALNTQITIQIVIENTGPVDCSAELMVYYVEGNNNEVLLSTQPITVLANGSLPVNVPWSVLKTHTTLIGRLVNFNIPQASLNGKEAQDEIGNVCTATITASGNTSFCEGGSVMLTASEGIAWLWSTNETTRSIAVTTPGDYSVTVTDASLCTATSAVEHITVFPIPTVTISASGPTTFCEAGSVTLTASGADSYVWSNAATTPSIVVVASGTYSVTGTNANGCTATSDAVTVVVNPNVDPGTVSGSSTLCIGTTETFTSNGTIGGTWSSSNTAVASVHPTSGLVTPLAAGTTDITYSITSGCGSPASSFVTLTVPPNVTAGTVCGSSSLCVGTTEPFTSNGTIGGNWTSSNTTVATVHPTSGLVTPLAAGTTNITYTITSGCGSPMAAFKIVQISTCQSFCTYTQGYYGNSSSITYINTLLPITVGMPGRSLTFEANQGACIAARLTTGGQPIALPSTLGDYSVGTLSCPTNTVIPLMSGDRFLNILLGQTVSLSLNIRGDAFLASFMLPASLCTQGGSPTSIHGPYLISPSIFSAFSNLSISPTVGGLLALANRALGGQDVGGASLSAINDAVSAINEGFDECRTIISCPIPKDVVRSHRKDVFLSQNFPNPFNPTTTISYSLPERAVVQLRVYDLIGREIAVLVNGEREAGVHTVLFDAHALDAGVYFYRLFAGNEVLSGAMTLVK